MGLPAHARPRRLGEKRARKRTERARVHDGHLAAVGLGKRAAAAKAARRASGFFHDEPAEEVAGLWERIKGAMFGGGTSKAAERQERLGALGRDRRKKR